MLLDKSKNSDLLFPIIVFAFIGYANISFDLIDGVSGLTDVDDKMRFYQIRDLFADRQWFDMQMPFIAMPEPYQSPWSRLVDLPYLVLAVLFSNILSPEQSLVLATWIVPPLLFLAFSWIAMSVATQLVDRRLTLAEAVAMAVLLGVATFEFSAGRIDHHNFQLLVCLGLAKGMVDPRPEHAAKWLGISTVASICIGLELIPLIAMVYLVLGLLAACGIERYVHALNQAGFVILLSTPFAALWFLGLQNSFATHCDAFSFPWILALLGLAFALIAVPRVWALSGGDLGAPRTTLTRIFIVLAILCPIAGMLWLIFPSCAGGVYHMIDDVSRAFWLDGIMQENSGAYYFALHSFMIAGMPAVLAVLSLGFIALHYAKLEPAQLKPTSAICSVVFFLVCLTMIQGRYLRFLPALTILLVPVIFQIVRSAAFQKEFGSRENLFGFSTVILATALLTTNSMWLAESADRTPSAADYMAAPACVGQDFAHLNQIEPALILAPFGISYEIAELDYGHQLLALQFHRASPGIRRMALAFTSDDLMVRNQALQPIEYVVVCASENAGNFEGAPLYRRLVEQTPTAGFELVASPIDTRVLIYRINHEKLAI